jgi:hypothetical protein
MKEGLIFDKLLEYGLDTQLGRSLHRELITGFQLEKELEKQRVESAASEAEQMRKAKGKMGDLQAVTTLPGREFFRLLHKYGHEEVHSKQFQRHLHKKMPELKIANV